MSKFLRKLRYFSPLAGVLAVVWMSVQYGGSNELLFLVPLYFVGATLGTIMFSFFIEWLLSKDKWVVSAWQKRLIVVSECAAIFLLVCNATLPFDRRRFYSECYLLFDGWRCCFDVVSNFVWCD